MHMNNIAKNWKRHTKYENIRGDFMKGNYVCVSIQHCFWNPLMGPSYK